MEGWRQRRWLRSICVCYQLADDASLCCAAMIAFMSWLSHGQYLIIWRRIIIQLLRNSVRSRWFIFAIKSQCMFRPLSPMAVRGVRSAATALQLFECNLVHAASMHMPGVCCSFGCCFCFLTGFCFVMLRVVLSAGIWHFADEAVWPPFSGCVGRLRCQARQLSS